MPTRKKNTTVVGVFESRARAEQAIADLRAAGFKDNQIGLVARDSKGRPVRTSTGEETYAEEGAVAGAATGAGLAALGSLAVSFGVIPVIGPILAVGPLAAALLTGAAGAAAGGIAGALIGWGIPEEDAAYYESEVKAGRFLVTVQAGNRADEARTVLARFGGFDRATRLAQATSTETTTKTNGRKSASKTCRTAATTETTESCELAGTGGRTVQLREEQLKARKTPEVKTGEVEVRKVVKTERKTVQVPVEREEVVIERKPVRGRVAASAADIKAEEIRIPVKEDKVTVTKETVANEEVKVGKRKVRDTETVSGDVRKEELVVETKGSTRVRNAGARK